MDGCSLRCSLCVCRFAGYSTRKKENNLGFVLFLLSRPTFFFPFAFATNGVFYEIVGFHTRSAQLKDEKSDSYKYSVLLWCHNRRNIAHLSSEEHHLPIMQLGGRLLVTAAPFLGGGFIMCLSGCVAVQRVSRHCQINTLCCAYCSKAEKMMDGALFQNFTQCFLRSPLICFHPAHLHVLLLRLRRTGRRLFNSLKLNINLI